MKKRIEKISIHDPEYPDQLRLLEEQAPKELYGIGDLSLLKRRCAAVVGARKATQYGKRVAYNAGKTFANYDIVTVSGMAYGCDTEAHKGALDHDGKTIAVLGCGPDICYPSGHRQIYEKIVKNGLILSEYPPGTRPLAFHFPVRNRIISGLSDLVLVAEASMASGSLITAGYAAEQGKTLMATPGQITNPMSIGCNKLIQDGVPPVVVMEDLISALRIPLHKKETDVQSDLGVDEKRIFEWVRREGAQTLDEISAALEMPASSVSALVSVLEIKGFLSTYMGKIDIARF